MKIFHHPDYFSLKLFSKRFCFQQGPEKTDDNPEAAKVETGYDNKESAEGAINDVHQRALNRVKKLGGKDNIIIQPIIDGKLEALKRQAEREIAAIEDSSLPDQKQRRALAVKKYQTDIIKYLGVPGLKKKVNGKVIDQEGKVVQENVETEVSVEAQAVENRNGFEIIKGEIKESNEDKGGEILQKYVDLVQKSGVDWSGIDDASSDKAQVIQMLVSMLGDNVGRGYLVSIEDPMKDAYIYGPLIAWITEQMGKDEVGDDIAEEKDVQRLTKSILEGRAKIETDTNTFRKEVADFKEKVTAVKNTLGVREPALGGLFTKIDYELTLGDKKGFEAQKMALLRGLQQAFNQEKEKLATKMNNWKEQLKPQEGLKPELETSRKEMLMQIQMKETSLLPIVVTVPEMGVISNSSTALKLVKDSMGTLETEIGKYGEIISPPTEGTPTNAPAGDSLSIGGGAVAGAAPESGGTKPTATAEKSAAIQVKSVEAIKNSPKGKKYPPKDQYDDIKEIENKTELEKMKSLQEVAEKKLRDIKEPVWGEAQTDKSSPEKYLVCYYYKNDADAKVSKLSISYFKAKSKAKSVPA